MQAIWIFFFFFFLLITVVNWEDVYFSITCDSKVNEAFSCLFFPNHSIISMELCLHSLGLISHSTEVILTDLSLLACHLGVPVKQ